MRAATPARVRQQLGQTLRDIRGERLLRLEADLAQADAALDDPRFLAHRLERLLVDQPDLRLLARYIGGCLGSAVG